MRWLTLLAAGLFAAGVLGLYMLVAGHKADLSRMPGEPPAAVPTLAAPPPPAADALPQPAGAPPAYSADPLAATVERLRAGLPATPAPGADASSGQPDATATAVPPLPDPVPLDGTRSTDDAGPSDVLPPDNPAASSAEAVAPPLVRAGQHTTALGVRWTLLASADTPAFVIHLGNGQDARVQVSPQFLALNLHAMSRNVESVRFLILHDYLGRAGDYLFTPDGRLARL
ncbi:MAG: hypothetical protein ACRYGC_12505 [Janthinobacterium lividum]